MYFSLLLATYTVYLYYQHQQKSVESTVCQSAHVLYTGRVDSLLCSVLINIRRTSGQARPSRCTFRSQCAT